MQTYPDCIPCLIRQGLDSMRLIGMNDKDAEEILKQVLRYAADFDMSQSPPEMAMRLHRMVREKTESRDPYREIKQKAIHEVLRNEENIRKLIDKSENPFHTAVRFAIAGNVLDFAIYNWSPNILYRKLDEVLSRHVDRNALESLEKSVGKAKNILFLGDNAGESVFDKLLIEKMHGQKVTYVVKGQPVINDVIMEDAVMSGINEVADIIDNGSDAPGTLLEHASEQFRNKFAEADLVIAKGQGNYESLQSCAENIYFLTQIKCAVIARDLNGNVGDWVVKHSDYYKETN